MESAKSSEPRCSLERKKMLGKVKRESVNMDVVGAKAETIDNHHHRAIKSTPEKNDTTQQHNNKPQNYP